MSKFDEIYEQIMNRFSNALLKSMKQAKEQYVKPGKLSLDKVKELSKLDPTPSNKYLLWIMDY